MKSERSGTAQPSMRAVAYAVRKPRPLAADLPGLKAERPTRRPLDDAWGLAPECPPIIGADLKDTCRCSPCPYRGHAKAPRRTQARHPFKKILLRVTPPRFIGSCGQAFSWRSPARALSAAARTGRSRNLAPTACASSAAAGIEAAGRIRSTRIAAPDVEVKARSRGSRDGRGELGQASLRSVEAFRASPLFMASSRAVLSNLLSGVGLPLAERRASPPQCPGRSADTGATP